MNRTATRARIRNFGSTDQLDAFAAKYGSADYAVVGAAIAAEQRKHNTRQEATVTDKPNASSITTLIHLAASRTPWVTREQVELFAATNDAKTVSEKIDWLEAQPLARKSVTQDTDWKAQAAAREAAEERKTYEAKMEQEEWEQGRNRKPVEVPEGRYAVTGADGATKFYKVDRPTEGRWAGYTFVKVQAGDELFNLKTKALREAVLQQIAEAGIQEAMLRYGRELGHCGHCGRTLTNEESREVGIGPICRGKMGF